MIISRQVLNLYRFASHIERPRLNAIRIERHNGEPVAVATNGHVLAMLALPDDCGSDELIEIPRGVARMICKTLLPADEDPVVGDSGIMSWSTRGVDCKVAVAATVDYVDYASVVDSIKDTPMPLPLRIWDRYPRVVGRYMDAVGKMAALRLVGHGIRGGSGALAFRCSVDRADDLLIVLMTMSPEWK